MDAKERDEFKTQIESRMSTRQSRLSTLITSGGDRTEAETTEVAELTTGLDNDRLELRAMAAMRDPITTETAPNEDKDRLELRKACTVGGFLKGYTRGGQSGAEAELQAELGVEPNEIPFEMWEQTEKRQADPETRATVTAAPSTTGINLDVLRPSVFAPSVAAKLMIDMPVVESGVYASGTITTNAGADAVPKGVDVAQTAAAFTVATTEAHRVGTSLALSAEDVSKVGTASFEGVLRAHISYLLADEVDDQLLNGDGTATATANNINGLISRLTYPTDTISTVAGFDDFVAAFAGSIDGLWATTMSEIAIVAGVDSYKLSAAAYRDPSTGTAGGRGATSFATYAMSHTAGWSTNSRMPAKVSDIQSGIVCRRGRSMMPDPMRTAVSPVWGGTVGIDDVISGARKGERIYTLYVLIGDVLVVQTGAYGPARFKVS